MLTITQTKIKKDYKAEYMRLKHELYNILPKATFKMVLEMVEAYYCYREPLSRYEVLVDKALRNAGKSTDLKQFLSAEDAEELRIEEERMNLV